VRQWTLAELKTKINNDMDTGDEDFVESSELTALVNEAIDEAEAHVHNLYEDYFITEANIALVSGTADYAYPSDIYASKVRDLYYENGATKYEILPIRSLKELPNISAGDNYRWRNINTSAGGPKIRFHPTPTETSSTNVTIRYLRNAKQLSATSDTLDIPEAANFIIAYAKMKIAAKEPHFLLPALAQEVEQQRRLLIETLTNRVDDENDAIQPDFSFYSDFDSDLQNY
jgi:hypothetical protein